MLHFENQFILKKDNSLAGSDEVGRGPLAGPVVAATVVITKINKGLCELTSLKINDSKKISSKIRKEILKNLDIDLSNLVSGKKYKLEGQLKGMGYFSVVEIQADEIDCINILQASLKAMRESLIIAQNQKSKGIWLVDGNKLPTPFSKRWRSEAIIKGDSKSLVIGLASIIAKEYRDHLMEGIGNLYPGYGLEKHAGYPTQFHRNAIKELGPTPYHRKSFKGVKEYL